MKKILLLLSLITLFCQSIAAQTGGLNFQGVARNATGAALANQKINLKFSILKTTETGAVEYTETKEVTTNAQGIFAVVVGEVNATSFAAVDWKVTPKFLKVEMDPAGGTSFVAVGTTRLQNVPYAYYANGVNSNNIDGTISIEKGGTGATDAAAARANLGLVIGTNVQAPLVAGTDYLAPTGSAASLTNFPTLNQNTTGNAASATIAGNITATSNATLTTLSNLNSVGTITSGVWSGTLISIAKGGTGLNVSGASGQVLSSTGSGTLTWTTPTTVTVGTISSTSNANGATITAAGVINLAPADASNGGVVTTNAQTIAGAKSFTGAMVVGAANGTGNSAALEVKSTTQGFLLPRLTTAQRDAIVDPAAGLFIYNSTLGKFQGYSNLASIPNTNYSGGGSYVVLSNFNMMNMIAINDDGQSFPITSNATLKSIEVRFQSVNYTSDITLSVYSGAIGSGTLLGSVTNSVSSAGEKTFTFSSPISLTAGNYYFQVHGSLTTNSGLNYCTNPYSSGSFFQTQQINGGSVSYNIIANQSLYFVLNLMGSWVDLN